MTEPIAYLCGDFVPVSQAQISIFDRGFLWADGVFDTARTVRHKPYLLREHLQRLQLSLSYVAIDSGLTLDELESIASKLIDKNARSIPSFSDLWIRIFVTRGLVNRSANKGASRATVIMATEQINFPTYAAAYRDGLRMVTPPIREVPSCCVDPRLKTMSRMHYSLAEQYVSRVAPGALPLMLDTDDFVAQGTGANVFAVLNGELVTPPLDSALAGISRTQVFAIARERQIPCVERRLSLYDLAIAEEAFMTGTSFCLLPIAEVNGRKNSTGQVPGTITQTVLEAWGEKIGIDIAEQARQHLAHNQ